MNCKAVAPISGRKPGLIPPVTASAVINRGSEAAEKRAILPGTMLCTVLTHHVSRWLWHCRETASTGYMSPPESASRSRIPRPPRDDTPQGVPDAKGAAGGGRTAEPCPCKRGLRPRAQAARGEPLQCTACHHQSCQRQGSAAPGAPPAPHAALVSLTALWPSALASVAAHIACFACKH